MKTEHLVLLGLVAYFFYKKQALAFVGPIQSPQRHPLPPTSASPCPTGYQLWNNYDPTTDTFSQTCEPGFD